MQDVNQTPATDTHDNTTQDPGINGPGMSAAHGNPSSDAGGSPNTDMSDVEGASVGDADEQE